MESGHFFENLPSFFWNKLSLVSELVPFFLKFFIFSFHNERLTIIFFKKFVF